MKYEASIYQMNVEGHSFWIAESKSLKGCIGQGETSEDAIKELEENEIEWIETAKDFGIPIPPISYRKEIAYSGKFSLRMSPILHEQASEISARLGISLNQYISDALGFYNAESQRRINKVSSGNCEETTSSNIIRFPSLIKAENPYTKIDIVENQEEL